MAHRPDQDALLSTLDGAELLELASRLIATPSVTKDVAAVMNEAASYLRAHRFSVSVCALDPSRPNLIATAGQGRPIVALNGHLDTVPVSDRAAWHTDPFTGTVRDGRLYGLGALDMKAPCAAMMMAAAKLAERADLLRGTIQLQVVCDEEEGAGYGTIFLADQIRDGALPPPDMVIMAEFSDLKVLHAERGTFKFEITFHGRSTHTMTARVDGVNPIVHAARAVLALDRPLESFDPQIGYGIISVNMIQAGEFASQVPAECKIVVDRRMLPDETDETCLAEAEAVIRTALKEHPDANFEVARVIAANGRPRYSPPNATAWDRPVVQAIARAHEAVTGEPAEPFVGWYGATDGRLFRLLGIDTVNYGPRGAHAHGANEYVDISSLETQLKVFVATLADLLGH